jgi:citrate synthase
MRIGGAKGLVDGITSGMAMQVLALGRNMDVSELHSGDTVAAGQRIVTLLAGSCGLTGDEGKYLPPKKEEPIAHLVARAFGITDVASINAINSALILGADHELSPSAFTARIVASTGADLHACIAAAICAHGGNQTGGSTDILEELLSGTLHRAQLIKKLDKIKQHGTRQYGFNHPFYPLGDPRAKLMIAMAKELSPSRGAMADMLAFLARAESECHAYPGITVGFVVLASALRMPVHAALTLWMVSRCAGLVGHVIEQRLAGYMLRPRARFAGYTA